MKKFYQGKYTPANKEKYKGDSNNIIYRSSWEFRFMRYCDSNPNIIEWGSEEFFINYFDPTTNKVRRYFPDFFVKLKNKSGEIKKYIIEVKPKKQTIEPTKTPKRKTKNWINEILTYEKNKSKWKAATEFCKDNLMEFKIITEDELGI
jgi:hypothetical protein